MGRFPDGGFEELATGHDHVALVYGDISGIPRYLRASIPNV